MKGYSRKYKLDWTENTLIVIGEYPKDSPYMNILDEKGCAIASMNTVELKYLTKYLMKAFGIINPSPNQIIVSLKNGYITGDKQTIKAMIKSLLKSNKKK